VAGTGFLSNTAAMTQAINAFEQCAQDARNAMNNLREELESTLANNYQGTQATAFWNLHTQLQEQMTTANQEINTMSTLVNQAFKTYQSGDETAQQSINQVMNTSSAVSSTLGRLTGV
jgi:uncharacterized protein YukE